MPSTYPPVSFFFSVEFLSGDLKLEKIGFQSVSGLSVEMKTEPLREGGENRFGYALPTHTAYNSLDLKRGLIKNTKILDWCSDAILNFDIRPVNLQVKLLNASDDQPLMTWDVINAWPQGWSVSEFEAKENRIAIESLKLSYQYFTIK